MRRVFVVTLPNGYFGSAWRSWNSLNVELVSSGFFRLGLNVYEVSIDEILNKYDLRPSDLVVYTSSENKAMRQYVKDVMYLVSKKCIIIPSYDLLMAHENKGFQELYRKSLDIGDLEGFYHIDHHRLPKKYPYVYKSTDGAGSVGVDLVLDDFKRKKIINKKERTSLKRKVVSFLRRLKLTERQFLIYQYNKKKFNGFVVQEFVEGLKFDYKVLVFWDKFYVLKRGIRGNDFRASGSGLFEFEHPSDELLSYAKEIFDKLHTPYASLDIAESKFGCKLIEFQALNFGPYTLVNSPGFYRWCSGKWHFVEGESILENEFSNSLASFVEKHIMVGA